MPNDQFLTPFVQIGYDGARFYNESIKEFLFNPTTQPPTLGRYFFTAAYLMVNHDSNTFTMWQGNPSSSSSLVKVINEETAEACGNVSGVVQQSATAIPSASATSATSAGLGLADSSAKVSTGAIVGSAIGGVALIAVLGVAALLLKRKRRQKQGQLSGLQLPGGTGSAEQGTAPQNTVVEKPSGMFASNLTSSHELALTHPPSKPWELSMDSRPFEMDGRANSSSLWESSHPVHEMDGRVYSFQP